MAILTSEAKTRLAQYKDEFLASKPNNRTNADGTLMYTDAQWLEVYVKEHLLRQIRVGDRKLKQQAIVIDAVDLDI